jgi:alkanesulfonate monooxygenase SsuD/methylene tetrahydromethanopterin reductase-like flavin-dependent oxidoreductase (luciferase family)
VSGGRLGVSVRERGARTDDHLAAAQALWTQRPTTYEGRFTTLWFPIAAEDLERAMDWIATDVVPLLG